jgi:hypothetical protein
VTWHMTTHQSWFSTVLALTSNVHIFTSLAENSEFLKCYLDLERNSQTVKKGSTMRNHHTWVVGSETRVKGSVVLATPRFQNFMLDLFLIGKTKTKPNQPTKSNQTHPCRGKTRLSRRTARQVVLRGHDGGRLQLHATHPSSPAATCSAAKPLGCTMSMSAPADIASSVATTSLASTAWYLGGVCSVED